MQVLVPIATRSLFFPETEYFFPQPLIEVDGVPIIERVVSSIKEFVDDPKFIFVVESSDCTRFSLDKLLMLLGGPSTVVVQKQSETAGALCSTLLAIDYIDLDQPIIVSNCDTALYGGIRQSLMKLMVEDIDAGVFTFNSIHPRWSYIRSSENHSIDQVHEKEVVSNQAIAGVYYFKSALQYIKSANEVILNDVSINGRFYISSTINQVILSGGKASFVELQKHQVQSFYSPQSIERFMKQSTGILTKEKFKLNIVIPAAGLGSRFAKEAWKKPKPFIEVNGKSMLENIMENLKIDRAEYSIVLQKQHAISYFLEVDKLQKLGANIVEISHVTEGTVCTILACREKINNDNPLLIANSDQIVDCDMHEFVLDAQRRNLDGSILVFNEPSLNPKWSYALINENGFVEKVAEKNPISENATVGIYYFKSGAVFVNSAIDMIVKNERVNEEFYTCPIYNYLIRNGGKVGVYEIDKNAMHGIGTPHDLRTYIEKKALPSSVDDPSS